MNHTTRTLTALTALTLTGIALAPSAAATDQATCTVTAQPQDNRSYHLAYTDNNGMHTLIANQDGRRLEPADFEIPADFHSVLWATKRGVIDGPDSFYDNLTNGGGCTFTEPYHAAPGWRASIVIRPGHTPSTTSTTVGTTTSTTPPTTPSTAPEATTTQPTVTVTRTTPLPEDPDLTGASWPTPTTGVDTEVRLTPDPTPYTLVPTLPNTGVDTGRLALLGLWLALPGALCLALRQGMRRHVATRTTHDNERTFNAE